MSTASIVAGALLLACDPAWVFKSTHATGAGLPLLNPLELLNLLFTPLACRMRCLRGEAGEQAARKLLEAAQVLAQQPEAMQLRYLSTLATIGAQNSTTVVFPFPTELAGLLKAVSRPTVPGPAP